MKKFINKQKFHPDLIGIFINPFYIARRNLYNAIYDLREYIGGNILDVGCGSKPYKNLFDFSSYIGIDIENPGHDHSNEDIDMFYDGATFPFKDSSFTSVITNQVLEHVNNPESFISEIQRVLKVDGTLLISVPFVWDEHEVPNDYQRYSSYGIIRLLELNNFKVIKCIKTASNLQAIFQLIALYIYKIFITKNKYLNLIVTILLISPVTLFGTLISLVTPNNNDLYLDNVIIAKKCS